MARPRSTAIDDRVRGAVHTLVQEVGYHALTIEQVASTAGVSRPAIYRRWPSKAEMVFTLTVHDASIEAPSDTGSLHDDLRTLVGQVHDLLASPVTHAVTLGVIAECNANPVLRQRFADGPVHAEHAVIETILMRARARGELRGDIQTEDVHAHLLGVLIARLHVLPYARPVDLVDHLTDDICTLISAPAKRKS